MTRTQKQNVPALRFPEFSGEWECEPLTDITSKIGSGSTPRGGGKVYQNFGIPFIRSQNVTNNSLVLDEVHISELVNDSMKGSIVQGGDVLLNITGGSIGRSCVVPRDFVVGNVNQHVSIIRPNRGYMANFIQAYLSSHRGQKLIYEGQTGSGREGLNFQSIGLFKIKYPALPEQKKIASFLSSVDTKIEQLGKRKALLEKYKKGMMQKLFSQTLRFPSTTLGASQAGGGK